MLLTIAYLAAVFKPRLTDHSCHFHWFSIFVSAGHLDPHATGWVMWPAYYLFLINSGNEVMYQCIICTHSRSCYVHSEVRKVSVPIGGWGGFHSGAGSFGVCALPPCFGSLLAPTVGPGEDLYSWAQTSPHPSGAARHCRSATAARTDCQCPSRVCESVPWSPFSSSSPPFYTSFFIAYLALA